MPNCHLIIAEPCANALVKPLKFLRIFADPQFRRFMYALRNAYPPACAYLTSHFQHPSVNPLFFPQAMRFLKKLPIYQLT